MVKPMGNQYDDIIHLPHPVSKYRKHMSVHDRAAQFAPFAALTGHEEAVEETARLTDAKIELDENEKEELDRRLQYILQQPEGALEVSITYFLPDLRKSGGAYIKATGAVKSLDARARILKMMDGTKILLEDILEINYT